MVNYQEINIGDILEITGAGAPGYAKNGDLVRVIEVHRNSVSVENKDGDVANFLYNCGAERLNATQWKKDFPQEAADDEG